MGASDLHIAASMPPLVRVHGLLKPLSVPPFRPEETEQMIGAILNDEQKKGFSEKWDIDFCYEIPEVGRFRANVLRQRNGMDAVFRYIPNKIPTPKDLGLNDTIVNFVNLNQGLILVTGPTRSGKTTTLAALIQTINEREPVHIITVEDPIEFIFPPGRALINQREVGKHTKSTAAALRGALREDPDIIMVGEMRDLETISLAISAAETGHLVLSTLQTQSAHKTVDRIVDSYPATQASQIRTMLSESLRGICSQQLLKKADNSGMVLATEILVTTTSISNLIRDGKTFQIPSIMQTGATLGMKKMDTALAELVRDKVITREEALRAAHHKKEVDAPLAVKKTGVQRGQA